MAWPSNSESVAHGQLRAFVERIERLDEDIRAMNEDKREVYAEARANGFDTRAIKAVVRIRREDPAERAERQAIIDLYLGALGMPCETEDEEAASRAHVQARAREDDSGPDAAEADGPQDTSAGEGQPPAAPIPPEAVAQTGPELAPQVSTSPAGSDAVAIPAIPLRPLRELRIERGCQKPDCCGSPNWRELCFACRKAKHDQAEAGA